MIPIACHLISYYFDVLVLRSHTHGLSTKEAAEWGFPRETVALKNCML